jgi:anti-sigma factor RsiW
MADRSAFDDQTVHDYLDGRLNPGKRAEVAAEITRNPALAAEVERTRRETDLLRAIGEEVLNEPVPARLRAVLHRQLPGPPRPAARSRLRWFAQAAAVVLLLGTGGGAGWIANDLLDPTPDPRDVMLANLASAFSFYTEDDGYPVDFPSDRADEFRGWVERVFARAIDPPDLAAFGYALDGGRVVPQSGVQVGAFQFTSPEKGRLAVFFWPDEAAIANPLDGIGAGSEVAQRIWSGNGFAVAVVGSAGDAGFEAAADAVVAFYQNVFGTT